MPNYQESSIYKLCCKDTTITDIYIGSTTNFRRRKCAHKNSCNKEGNTHYNTKVYKGIRNNGGWDNWDMIQIKEVSCNNKKELNAIEREFIEKLKPTLNYQLLLNRTTEDLKKYIEEHKEQSNNYQKNFREKNKEYIKQWRKNNKEKIVESGKEYRSKNKEKIKIKNQLYYQKKLNIKPN